MIALLASSEFRLLACQEYYVVLYTWLLRSGRVLTTKSKNLEDEEQRS